MKVRIFMIAQFSSKDFLHKHMDREMAGGYEIERAHRSLIRPCREGRTRPIYAKFL